MKSGNRNLILIIAGVVIVGLVLITVMLLRDTDSEDIWKDNPDITRNEEPGTNTNDADEALGITPNDPVERLERFKKWAQYPPQSRPLTEGNVDLIDPYNAEKTPLSVIAKPGKNCKERSEGGFECEEDPVFSETKCKMTPESSISVGKHDFRLTLYCHNNQGEKLAISNLSAKMERWFNRQRFGSLPPISMGDDGTNGDQKAGDKIYTIVVRTGTQDWGQMTVTADFEVEGLKHSQRADFYSTPHIVAEFNEGGIRDSVEDGSLYIYVPVNIKKAGYYEFQANLQEAGGDKRFIAHSTVREDFKAGPQNIRFEFFGKIIRDINVDGPYVVREIRGKRHNSPVSKAQAEASRREGTTLTAETTEPLWEDIEPLGKDYTTQAYTVSQFSNTEYDSEEKQRRLQFYESLTK
ncbi:MAG: hypothetical protein KDK39_11095 [Leptospiraceae bacterium]|nr:hypothetical protein [Leptospiraceae bacterium]